MLDSFSLIAGGPLLIVVVEDGVIASNSEHLVFDMYACHSGTPLVSFPSCASKVPSPSRGTVYLHVGTDDNITYDSLHS